MYGIEKTFLSHLKTIFFYAIIYSKSFYIVLVLNIFKINSSCSITLVKCLLCAGYTLLFAFLLDVKKFCFCFHFHVKAFFPERLETEFNKIPLGALCAIKRGFDLDTINFWLFFYEWFYSAWNWSFYIKEENTALSID